jgi:hypothetical protein
MRRSITNAIILSFMIFISLSIKYGIPYHKIQGKKSG